MLVLREVTHADQGLYAIKLSSGFTYETVHLTVSGNSIFLPFSLYFIWFRLSLKVFFTLLYRVIKIFKLFSCPSLNLPAHILPQSASSPTTDTTVKTSSTISLKMAPCWNLRPAGLPWRPCRLCSGTGRTPRPATPVAADCSGVARCGWPRR